MQRLQKIRKNGEISKMLIIVEGSNRVGKSALISKLVKMYGVEKVYNRNINAAMKDRQQESFIAANAMLDVAELAKNQNIIFDRFHLSEYIYGAADRGYIGLHEFNQIDERLSKMDCMLVVVTSKYEHEAAQKFDLPRWVSLQYSFKAMYKASKIKDKIQICLEEIE